MNWEEWNALYPAREIFSKENENIWSGPHDHRCIAEGSKDDFEYEEGGGFEVVLFEKLFYVARSYR